MSRYAELCARSNFSFLDGASHADELVLAAKALGLAGLSITDRNSLAGVVRGHLAAKAQALPFVVGTRIELACGAQVLVWPSDRAAYGRLSRLLSTGKLRAPKGECHLGEADLMAAAPGQVMAILAGSIADPASLAARLAPHLALPPMLAASATLGGSDAARLDRLADQGLPLLAIGDVRFHAPERRRLADVLSAIRLGCTVDGLGLHAEANAERHLQSPEEIARRFARHPDALARSIAVLETCRFRLDELRYEYPDEITQPGVTPQAELEGRTWEAAQDRYEGAVPPEVRARLIHELRLIATLRYAPYFLTVHEIVRFARSQGILCQGRGSAANSAVCYVLGITSVDPAKHDLLFERFVSAARNEPPDIDVDFEHERREEVIQWIYQRYGRDRAGLAATVIHYRHRRAIREVGKALGLSEDITGRIANNTWGPGGDSTIGTQADELGLDRADPRLAMACELAEELTGFPRHLSQHVGGFVITRGPLIELCPVANAAMADRTTIEWDKDDIEALGILKVDVLALGMLSCVRRAFDLLALHYGRRLTLASVPAEDDEVYAMLRRADSLGVFQVESRAQMNMLPRLRPRTFYDLVIEVAIVRPGPIQGDMVHPYLRRRNREEEVTYPSDELRQVLGRTLGVPLFQEQAMKIAIVAAGFSPEDADRLRRAMATFKKVGIIHEFRTKMIEGMVARGYERAFAEACFRQIEGFGTYGFPESHAASFALLVYVSSWIKCHYPAAFACALLNSQPMGFYAPAQIVRDAREHGVTVRPVDVNHSHWDNTLEPELTSTGGVALRLGFRQVKGLREDEATRLVAARSAGNGAPFVGVDDLATRVGLGRPVIGKLAASDAFGSLGVGRRAALWEAGGIEAPLPLFQDSEGGGWLMNEPTPDLPAMTAGEETVEDYSSISLTLKSHPIGLLRPVLSRMGLVDTRDLDRGRDKSRIRLAGLVLVRQRPGSAKGVIFLTLEDEWGSANVVVLPPVFARFRPAVIGARLMVVLGRIERFVRSEVPIVHLLADRVEDRTDLLGQLHAMDGEHAEIWDRSMARADEVRRGSQYDARDGSDPVKRRFPGSRDFH